MDIRKFFGGGKNETDGCPTDAQIAEMVEGWPKEANMQSLISFLEAYLETCKKAAAEKAIAKEQAICQAKINLYTYLDNMTDAHIAQLVEERRTILTAELNETLAEYTQTLYDERQEVQAKLAELHPHFHTYEYKPATDYESNDIDIVCTECKATLGTIYKQKDGTQKISWYNRRLNKINIVDKIICTKITD